VGSGQQYISWIGLDDAVGAIVHAIQAHELSGPVNAVAPQPVTNREFTKTLGSVLSRPTLVPLPAFAARLAFGEMADALLLASTRVQPARLLESGYTFQHASLEDALRHALDEA
jgi:NAD dependent epimerase/dehydratase family enzyme